MPTLPAARIRPATVLDAPAIARAHLQAWRETYGELVPAGVYAQREAEGPGRWEAMLADPGATMTWVAQRDDEVVGFATALAAGPAGVRPLQLSRLYVLAAEQGRRTGTHLLELAIGDAPCFLWVAEGNTRAQGFYRSHGFEADGAREPVAAGGHLLAIRMVR
ncbi:GNAT family N-acetyltransferase [Georgenia thermotolerans]|uniref:GNAT family N-acetyltransferase n=1 Tax=Georgenia thermotolerans TaxID=527326 RepID=A0A7J5UL13_9MICO|nr:GNAT family N-acetyltransferase [Georgenia thermotolerans]KAE8763078.1 GNAT family N-acetyltransferase [Georgenia thermotolerans]